MEIFIENLENIVKKALQKLGIIDVKSLITISNRKDLGQFQSNIAFSLAKKLNVAPMILANRIKDLISEEVIFSEIIITEPGFINFSINNNYLNQYLNKLFSSENLPLPSISKEFIIMDYGGVNIAKSMHVGHLRSAIIGESLKRIFKFLGCEVVSDIHLGDWGLPMGMLIEEVKERYPEIFSDDYSGDFPITINDLEILYPFAAQKCKDNEDKRTQARIATKELQNGNKKYLEIWKYFVSISVSDIKRQFSYIDVYFDLWLGESDSNDLITEILESLKKKKLATLDDGALIINIEQDSDKTEIPPLILVTSDNTITYALTDLATIYQRVEKYSPDKIIYIVDKRQSLHFEQVFKAATKANLINDINKFEHLGFGTINGLDNKPFKTREGAAMPLSVLIDQVIDKAKLKLSEEKIGADLPKEEQEDIVRKIAISTIKFADLSHEFKNNYIFDIDKFTSFQGKTGPYILYSAVRIKSLIKKAEAENICSGEINISHEAEIELALKLIQFPSIIENTYKNRAPHILCDYVYSLAQNFSTFYQNCSVLKAEKPIARSRISLVKITLRYLEHIVYLLGINIPDRM